MVDISFLRCSYWRLCSFLSFSFSLLSVFWYNENEWCLIFWFYLYLFGDSCWCFSLLLIFFCFVVSRNKWFMLVILLFFYTFLTIPASLIGLYVHHSPYRLYIFYWIGFNPLFGYSSLLDAISMKEEEFFVWMF